MSVLTKVPGVVIGGEYTVLDILADSGTGLVYLCEQHRDQRKVAVKVFAPDACPDPERLDHFSEQVRQLAALQHPNLAPPLEVGCEGESRFLVSEYIDGQSLADLVRDEGPLDLTRAADYILQAAKGLRYTHEAGWTHRDIRPEKLYLDATGTVRLLDLGQARLFTPSAPPTPDTMECPALGTGDYLAPECIDAPDAPPSADIYGLGASFYYLLAGVPPFHEQATLVAKLEAHRTLEPTPILAYRPELPVEIAELLTCLLAKEPTSRPALGELIDALWPWTTVQPSRQAARADTIEATTFEIHLPESVGTAAAVEELLSAHQGAIRSVVFSSDDRYVASGGADGRIRLWRVADCPSDCSSMVEDSLGEIQGLAFYPGQTWLVTASSSATASLWVWRYSERHGQQTFPVPDVPAYNDALIFTRDGSQLITALSSEVVFRATAHDAFTQRAVLKGQHGDIKVLALSNDGKQLACGSAGAVQVWQQGWFGGWSPTLPLLAHPQGTTALAFAPAGKMLASAGLDGTVRVWSVASQTLFATLPTPQAHATALRFIDHGKKLVVALADGLVQLWDLHQTAPEQNWHLPDASPGATNTVVLSHAGTQVALGTADGRFALFNLGDA